MGSFGATWSEIRTNEHFEHSRSELMLINLFNSVLLLLSFVQAKCVVPVKLTHWRKDESGIHTKSNKRMEEIDHFGQRVTNNDDLTEVKAEELAGYAVQSGHEQETLRPDEI